MRRKLFAAVFLILMSGLVWASRACFATCALHEEDAYEDGPTTVETEQVALDPQQTVKK